jgi:NAD(P) transhydrogenase subunit alpha
MVLGDDTLAAKVPTTASIAYAAAVGSLLEYLMDDGVLTVDPTNDRLQSDIVVTHGGEICNGAVWESIARQLTVAGLP